MPTRAESIVFSKGLAIERNRLECEQIRSLEEMIKKGIATDVLAARNDF